VHERRLLVVDRVVACPGTGGGERRGLSSAGRTTDVTASTLPAPYRGRRLRTRGREARLARERRERGRGFGRWRVAYVSRRSHAPYVWPRRRVRSCTRAHSSARRPRQCRRNCCRRACHEGACSGATAAQRRAIVCLRRAPDPPDPPHTLDMLTWQRCAIVPLAVAVRAHEATSAQRCGTAARTGRAACVASARRPARTRPSSVGTRAGESSSLACAPLGAA
jgi:hypothetical protein